MKKPKEMTDRELKIEQYIALIIAIIGSLAIFVMVATWFDNFISHILAASFFITAFYLILDLIYDISTDIDNYKRAKKKDKFNNKIIKLNDYKKGE